MEDDLLRSVELVEFDQFYLPVVSGIVSRLFASIIVFISTPAASDNNSAT